MLQPLRSSGLFSCNNLMATLILPTSVIKALTLALIASASALANPAADSPALQDRSASEAQLFPLTSVRLLDGPFAQGVAANRAYLLALDPDRLLGAVLP